MKFIIRNLGWILLIIFFIFMLYLISSQNNVKTNELRINTGTVINLSNTDSIIEEEIKIVSDETSIKVISGEAIANSNTGSFMQSIRDFFSFDSDVKYIEEETNAGVVDEDLIKKVDSLIDSNGIDINKKNIQKVAVKSLFLNNAYFTKRLYTAYKGDELEQLTDTNKYGCFKVKVISSKDLRNNGKIAWTCEYYMEGKTKNLEKYKIVAKDYYKNIKQINKTYKVGIKSLKLNNSTFDKKLGIVFYGDKVKQLTPTNKYGCFQIEVLNSKNIKNNGKIAWACKKYLK